MQRICGICNRKKKLNAFWSSTTRQQVYCMECFATVYNHKDKVNYSFPNTDLVFPCPEMFKEMGENHDKRKAEVSQSPFKCPHSNCQISLSIATILKHFQFDHKQIPIRSTQIDAKHSMVLKLENLNEGETNCIVILTIAINTKKWKPVFNPMILLLVRQITNHDVDQPAHTRKRTLIWMASDIPTAFSYTVGVSSMDEEFRIKYHGELHVIRKTLKEIIDQGEGLLIDGNNICVQNGECRMDVVVHDD